MSRIPHLVHSRAQRRKARRNSTLGRAAFGFALFVSLFLFAAALGSVVFYNHVSRDLPSPAMIPALLEPEQGALMQPTTILDREGEEVLWTFEHPAVEERSYGILDLDQQALRTDIPPEMVKAVLAVTDPRYFSRSDIGILRWRTAEAKSVPRRLVSELMLWQESHGARREIRERILASQLTAQYGREKVLEWYLNSLYFGRQIYGAVSASEVYFGKPLSQINTAEAAMLIAISEAPALNPFDAPRAARERQLDLIERMVEAELITGEEGQEARSFRLRYNQDTKALEKPRPAFVEYVLNQAVETIPRERLVRGGFVITSSLDAALQQQLQCVLDVGIPRLRGEASAEESNCEAARLLPNYPGAAFPSPDQLETHVVQLDPDTGQVLALAGKGPNGRLSAFPPHPPGSLLTPFIYLTTFTQGYAPAALVWDIPMQDTDLTVGDVHPACDQDCQYHGPVNIRVAMANDYLVPAIKFWDNFRPRNVENTLTQLGVDVPDAPCPDCQLFRDSHALSILDIAQSYGVFSQGGQLRGWAGEGGRGDLDPAFVVGIADVSGRVWRENPRIIDRSVISQQLAYMITHVLSDQNARQPSMGRQNVFDIGRPAAVKMGYTALDEVWTVGYTPQLVTAVWVGASDGLEGEASGNLGKVASGLWRALTQYALKGWPVESWQQPAGMTTLDVCTPSGLLPTEHCPEIVNEIFIQGSQPTQRDNLYQVVEVNQETGRLATVFTPPERIETRTYINFPPEAKAWADRQGISTPPEEYDVGERLSSSSVKITAPRNFAFLKDQVEIRGTVPEEDLVSYRLQVGKGLNPKTWQGIGEERQGAVEDGLLTTWDTGLVEDGLYALQLVVVRGGQRVERASVLVSIDNTSPEVSLSDDLDGRQFTYQAGEEILFRAQAVDNASLDVVKFYLDTRLAASRNQPPFAFSWEMEPGTHTLQVRALDEAGNGATQSVTFQVVP